MSKNLRFNFLELDLGLRIKNKKSTPALLLLFVCSIRGAIRKKLIFRPGAGISLLRSNKWLFELTWPPAPDPSDKHILKIEGLVGLSKGYDAAKIRREMVV